MADPVSSKPSLSERLMDVRLIEAALAQAVGEALLRHKLARNPIAEWRDGPVVWVAPGEIPVDHDG